MSSEAGQPVAGRGRLWVIAAPSGAGKTTLVHALMRARPNIRFSVSYTTRPPRPGERPGEDYFFVEDGEFATMVAAGEFLEHAEVFGRRYGTARAQVEALLDQGFDVLLEIDWQGARQVRAAMPECRSIFILPPSLGELERRLRGRATDEEAVIQRRLSEARDDVRRWAEFDYVVVNEQLEAALAQLIAVIDGEGAAAERAHPAVVARARAIAAD